MTCVLRVFIISLFLLPLTSSSQEEVDHPMDVIHQYIKDGKLDEAKIQWKACLSEAHLIDDEWLKISKKLSHALFKIDRHRQALEIYDDLLRHPSLNPKQSIAVHQSIGWLFHMNQQVDSARFHLHCAYNLSIAHDSISLKEITSILGILETKNGQYTTALTHYLLNLQLAPVNIKDTTRWIGVCFRTAKLFKLLENPSKAQTYFDMAIQMANQSTHPPTLLRAYRLAGIFYREENDIKAIEYLKKSESYLTSTKDHTEKISIYVNMASVYLNMDSISQASHYLSLAEPFINKAGFSSPVHNYYVGQAQVALHRLQLNEAKNYLKRLPKKLSPNVEIKKSIVEKDIALKEGRFDKAYYSIEKQKELEDSLFQIQNNQIIFNLEKKYQTAQKEKQISELSQASQIQDYRIKRTNTILLFTLIILGLITIFTIGIWRLFKTKSKYAEEISQKNMVIEHALENNKYLMKEIHHRVKNNLQVISSLFSLQTSFVKNPEALRTINESRDRIKSMTLIHQGLYQKENMRGVNVRDYFEKLAHGLFVSYHVTNQRIELDMDIDNIVLDLDTIMPLGLILNELISNSLKYAFPEGRTGRIKIRLNEVDDHLLLQVKDNGIGFDEDSLDEKTESFGMEMIRAFLVKLKASITFKNINGTQVDILITNYIKT